MNANSTQTAPPPARLGRRQLVLVTAGLMIAVLLAALDGTIVGTALPRIIGELNGLSLYAWVLTSYMVASTLMVPIAGKLGDLYGRKNVLLAGMVGFLAGSALCGLSQNMPQLVAFRGVQGLFGGVLFSASFAAVADLYEGPARAKAQGLFGAVFGLASVVGPYTGGLITDTIGWRWAFYVNLPVGALAILFVLLTMPRVRPRGVALRDIDFAGAATLALGLVPALVALSLTRTNAWTSPLVMGLLVFGGVFLGVFYLVEQRAKEPIVPFALFRNPTFAMCVVISFVMFSVGFGSFVFIPLLYQGVTGASATSSGQLLTPMMLGMVFSSSIVGFLMPRGRYYRIFGVIAACVLALGFWLTSKTGVETSSTTILVNIIILGMGLGVGFPLFINAVQNAMPRDQVGVGSAQINFWQNVGGTVGIAVLGSLMSARLPSKIGGSVGALGLSPEKMVLLPGGSDPQALFDPRSIAAARAALPPGDAAVFDQLIQAVRSGLAMTLQDIFLMSMAMAILAAALALFLKEAPFSKTRDEGEGGTSPGSLPS